MSERRREIYVSSDVLHSLILIAKAGRQDADAGYAGRLTTADEVADRILREYLESHYAQLFEHQKQVDKLEKEVVASLSKPK